MTLVGFLRAKGIGSKIHGVEVGWGQQGYGFIDESSGVCNYAFYLIVAAEANKSAPTSCC